MIASFSVQILNYELQGVKNQLILISLILYYRTGLGVWERDGLTFVIVSNDGLEGHELHVYISSAISVLVIGVCDGER